jgi:DnaJ family protein A protein 2
MFFGGGGGGFPFGDMGGGMPGGMGRQRRDVDNSRLYKVLGVEKNASHDEIARAYKKLAVKNHPDRGGDKEKFQEIQEAGEHLKDKDKRERYD